MAQFAHTISASADLAAFTLYSNSNASSIEFGSFESVACIIWTRLAARRSLLVFDAAGSSSVTDIIVKIHDFNTSTSVHTGPSIHLDTSAYSGYLCGTRSSDDIVCQRFAGESTDVLGTSVQHINGWHYSRIRRHGDNVQCKRWAGDIVDDQPSAWDIDTTDTTYASSGAVGLSKRSSNVSYVSEIYIGTDGDPAPTGPVGGTRRRSPLLLTPW